jgi:hypothetical protein
MATKKKTKRKIATLNVQTGEVTPVLGIPLERLEQIVAEARASSKEDDWMRLVKLITDYAVAYADDNMKGGGDPDAIPIIEQELERSRMRLNYHINLMRTKLEGRSQS